MTEFKHTCIEENAARFNNWIKNRGGIARWDSLNLSNPGASWSTPALTEDGDPYEKPTWQCSDKPKAVFTDPEEVGVETVEEVKRFRVGIRQGVQGLSLKVTDGGSRRIRKEIEKAGDGAYNVFDYMTQEAVIMKPVKVISLREWVAHNE